MARIRIGILGLCAAFAESSVEAATYTPSFWEVTPSVGFDLVDPTALNAPVKDFAPVSGLIDLNVGISHGFSSPDWVHWIQGGFHTAKVTGQDLDLNNLETSVRYIGVIPLAATYWFERTAYVDFGFGLGGGIGLQPLYKFTKSTPAGATLTTSEVTGSIAPLIDTRMHMRLWLGQKIGITLTGGFKIYNPKFELSGTSTSVNLGGPYFMAGATIPLTGEVKGTGRQYVEILPPEPPKPAPSRPAPAPSRAPVPPARVSPVPTPNRSPVPARPAPAAPAAPAKR